jgi:hypothetical protein
LVVAQSSSEIPEGLTNNPVLLQDWKSSYGLLKMAVVDEALSQFSVIFSAKFIPRLSLLNKKRNEAAVLKEAVKPIATPDKGALQSDSNVKTLLGVFLNFRVWIPYEFLHRNKGIRS